MSIKVPSWRKPFSMALGFPEHRPVAALRLRLGLIFWGRNTGIKKKSGEIVEMPDEILLPVHDRPIDDDTRERVAKNLIRVGMIQTEGAFIRFIVVIIAILAIVSGAGIFSYVQSKAQDAQQQMQQQYNPYGGGNFQQHRRPW